LEPVQREGKAGREIADVRLAAGERREDRAARRIGDRVEHVVQAGR
jgi:hypothetical protein